MMVFTLHRLIETGLGWMNEGERGGLGFWQRAGEQLSPRGLKYWNFGDGRGCGDRPMQCQATRLGGKALDGYKRYLCVSKSTNAS